MEKLNTEKFIEKAKLVHGDKYDYSLVNYVDCTTPVKIICPIHGEFEQKPPKHTSSKHGCPKCGHSKKDLTQKFIEEAKLIHGDSYDYSEVVWNGFKEKLKIICPEHGAFYMTRNHHIVRQQGCPICAISKRGHKLTNQEFIDRAKNIYGDFYSYEKTNYQGWYSTVIITCPIHGDFEVKANLFLTKQAHCSKCSSAKKSKTVIDNSKLYFLEHIKDTNKDINLISKWKGLTKKSKFKCNVCGHIWETVPQTIIKSQTGCPKCSKLLLTKTHEQFIQEVNLINNKIEVIGQYVKCDVPVECKCLICGKTFLTLPTRILQGYGCNKCNKSKGEMLITNIFDSYNILYESQKCINFHDRKFYIDFCVNNTFIEYNGRQHYIAIDYFGGDASYQKQVERDILLRNYCKEHDITLIEIPYTADNRDKILNYLTPILNEYNINL